jgi:hypothetical protein
MTTRIETKAFAVVDDHGNENMIVRTTPMRSGAKPGEEVVVELGVELLLRNGDSVMAISDTEFESADGRRWRIKDAAHGTHSP